MYFIVYLLESGTFEVIPENWIRDMEPQREKFLNNGLNRNQMHVCFWTNGTAARNQNGVIRLNFSPDFNVRFGNIFPTDGCYLCLIVKAKGNGVINILN